MDSAEVVYLEDEEKHSVATGDLLPGSRSKEVVSVEVDEEGQWVLMEVSDRETGKSGSVMIPKERIIRINEGSARS